MTLMTPAPLLPGSGTLSDARVFAPMLARLGRPAQSVTPGGAESAPEMAERILDVAPPRFEIAFTTVGARLALIERASHHVPLDQPDTVAREIRDGLVRPARTPSDSHSKEFT